MRNVHHRRINASPAQVGWLLDTLGSIDDRLWPPPPRDPMVLRHDDGDGVRVGARGGHGPIRYRVTQHVPGRRVAFAFDRGVGIDGWHAVEVDPLPDGTTSLRHVLEGRTSGAMRILWPLLVRSIHGCYVEDAFDRAERELGVGPVTEHRHSVWTRVVGRRPRRRVTATAPVLDGLGAAALPHVDAADAFRTDLLPGDGTDPLAWTTDIFSASPRWVDSLMELRHRLVRPFGLETGEGRDLALFPLHDRSETEVLTGVDDRHLDFRVVTTVDERTRSVTLTTVVRIHSRLGRSYWALVRHFHPRVVRSLMRRTAQRAGHHTGPPAA